MNIIIEQAAIKADFDYWTIDLKENDLKYDEKSLKNKFIGQKIKYLGFDFNIKDVEFYSIHKDKAILVAVKQ